MRLRTFVLVLVLLSMVGTSLTTDALPDAGPVPSISIHMEPSQAEAAVTQREGDDVQFTGTVEVDQPAYVRSNVTLECTVNTGWGSVIEPNMTSVTGPDIVRFTVTVTVPSATSSLLVGNVNVQTSVKAPLLAPIIASTSAVVTADQYFSARLEFEEFAFIRLGKGESDQVELVIYNDGNGQDTFVVSLEEVPPGLRASLQQSQVVVQQRESGSVVIDVTVDQDSDGGTHKIVVKVTSSESQGDYSRTEPLLVHVQTLREDLKVPGLPVPLVLVSICLVAAILRERRRG